MNKIFKLFKNNCQILENLPTPIFTIFDRFRALISYNILDLSFIKEIILYLHENIKKPHEEYTLTELFTALRKEIKRTFSRVKDEIKKELNLNLYYQIINLTIFWYILIFSMQNAYDEINPNSNERNFYEIFFEKNCMFMRMLKKIISYVKRTESQDEIYKLISNIFSENGEIMEIFYSRKFYKLKLDELLYYNKKVLSSVIPEINDYEQNVNDVTSSIYKKLLENIINVNFSYESMFTNSNNESFCLPEDKPLIKSMFCQSILRIVFSQEKNKFIDINNIFYELLFMKNVVRKCVSFYYEKFGDNVNCLFRREEVPDDLIKYIFFIFGNNFFYKACYLDLKKIIDTYSHEDSMTDILYLSHDEFIIFYEDLLTKIKIFIPNNIKILLKLIYQDVLDIYTGKISSGNYSPVLTILFFNFLISPKMQEIYNISPIKNILVKNLNRLIRNICFNEKFKSEDSLSYYNDIIEPCHLHTKSAIEKIMNTLLLDDMDFLLKAEMETNMKLILMPSFLFYFDCDYILNALEFSKGSDILVDLSKEVSYIEKMMNKRNSFYIKFNLEDFKKLKILDSENENEESEEGEEVLNEGVHIRSDSIHK